MADDYVNDEEERYMDTLFQGGFDANGNILDVGSNPQVFQSQPCFGADPFNGMYGSNLPPSSAFGNPYTSPLSQLGQAGVPEGQGFGSYAQSLGSGFGVGYPLSDNSAYEGDFVQPFNLQSLPLSFPQFGYDGNMDESGVTNSPIGELEHASQNSNSTPGEASGTSVSIPNTPLPLSAPTSRKRPRDSFGASHRPRNPPHNPTRQLAGTFSSREQTPSSIDSAGMEFGEDINENLLKLLGGDPGQDLAEMREYQKKLEEDSKREQRQKVAMERQDREYAERLHMEMNASQAPFNNMSSRPSTGSSNQDRNASNALPSSGNRHLDIIPPFSVFDSSPPRPANPRVRAGPSTGRSHDITTNGQDLKRATEATTKRRSVTGFVDVGSDTDDDTGNGLDDEPQVIGARSFGLSRTPQQSRNLPWTSSSAFGNNQSTSFGAPLMDLTTSSPINTPLPPPFREVAVGTSPFGRGNETHGASLMERVLSPTIGLVSNHRPTPIPSSTDTMALNQEELRRLEHINALERAAAERAAAEEEAAAQHLRSLVSNIRPDEDLGADDRTGTPEDMADGAALYKHQKLGLAWMIKMEEGSNKGGILADDMGLGKTIQAIALMVSRRSFSNSRKTNLIVAPVALLKQWESEIKVKVKPDRRLSTYIYHGSHKDITWAKLKQYDVIITTYATLGSEYGRKERIDMQRKWNPNWEPTSTNDRLPLLGDECKFYRIFLDEAQNIKNRNTKSAKAVYQLQALTRFCMTGTPMMNNVTELYSLIRFLGIEPYCVWDKFNHQFSKPLKRPNSPSTPEVMRKLQALLKAILLRRTKQSKIDGEPIISLTSRSTEINHTVFDDDQRACYVALETQTQNDFNRYFKRGQIGANYTTVLTLLLRLRQACCHPHLIRDFNEGGNVTTEVTQDELLRIARECLAPDVVNRIKAEDMDCPVCMDSAENARIFTPCGHFTCSECFARVSDSQAIMNDGGAFKCMNCRGRCDPKHVTDYRSFRQVYIEGPPEGSGGKENENDKSDSETDSDSDSDSDSNSDSDAGSLGSLRDFVVDDDDEDVPEENSDAEDPDSVLLRTGGPDGSKGKGKARLSDMKAESKSKGDQKSSASKGKEIKDETQGKMQKKDKKSNKNKRDKKKKEKKKLTLAQLQKEGRRNMSLRQKYMKKLEKDWVSSCKIDKCLEILEDILGREDGQKAIIFSQFTTLLDLVEIPIVRRNWRFKRYDGGMSGTARNDAVLEFSSRPDCRIILISLKAGNAGLNLTAANNIILLDPFWNPYIEEQAIDRAHRIGQRRDVSVHRILVEDTVEDRIIALQERKRALIEGALDEEANQSIGRLGIQELAYLFGIRRQPT